MSLDWERELLERLSTQRVAVTGPSGAGKSTFVRMLALHYGGEVHQEGAREWLAAHHVRDYWRMSPKLIAEMQHHLLSALETSEAQIFDRFSADTSYFALPAKDELDWPEFQQRAVAVAQTFDAIIFFPYRAEYLKDDGVRYINPRYQLSCASTIYGWLEQHELLSRTMIFQHHESFYDNAQALSELMSTIRIQDELLW